MNKQEVYEHLARIYLDSSKKHTPKNYQRFIKPIIFFCLFLILSVSVFFIYSKPSSNSQISVILTYQPVKINFIFDPAKKEIYSLDLKGMDLRGFKSIGFLAKKGCFESIKLRVEFSNKFKEKGSFYITDIASNWKEYIIDLAKFKDISHWENIDKLSFIVEEWNVKTKKGFVYIDDIKLLK
ncbi:MAG: hypothetical protein NC900_04125 [Candidatus Omnitrophica bacterium]|nr:hypothetical protein [Candidatus Omnitrophota bacterium]